MTRRPRVLVVGGGLTGLATAWRLRDHADVTVLEQSDRLGGAIRTVEFDGVAFDVGADAFLARESHACRLALELGFRDDELMASGLSRVLVHDGRRTYGMPSATVMGVPTRPGSALRSQLLGVRGGARAAFGSLRRWQQPADDVSVEELVGRRYGPAVVGRLVEPLLGGVYAGLASRLSAEATLPGVFATTGRLRPPTSTGVPLFRTVTGGLGRLVDRLAGSLGETRIETSATVREVGVDADGVVVTLDGARSERADVVVLAVPASAARRLVEARAERTAAGLAELSAASVATVALAYERDTASPPRASGVLVTRGAGLTVKAVTFSAHKWPHLADHPRTLVRASVGRAGEQLPSTDDAELAAEVDTEVRMLAGFTAPALARAVYRWPGALAQYEVGHRNRVARMREAIAEELPGVVLAGAAFDGVGIAARCREAEQLSASIRRATGTER